jgi:hypothetical protein
LKEFFSVENHCPIFKQPIVLRFAFGQKTIRQNYRHDDVLNERSPGIAVKKATIEFLRILCGVTRFAS